MFSSQDLTKADKAECSAKFSPAKKLFKLGLGV
jgi:hypothetical protein